jgi:VIT1/CCC1 family predicted Fe2+/Mn2+ transporter
MTTLLVDDPVQTPPAASATHGSVLAHATVREIVMGAQDNLTTVLAVMLGVSIGSGRADMVALAGLSAAVAEAVSMGGVLYNSTRAEAVLDAHLAPGRTPTPTTLAPVPSGIVTFLAAMLGGLVPLSPFAILPLPAAVYASVIASITALFILGSVTGLVSGSTWWRDGLRLLLVAGVAASASAVVGAALPVS